MPIAQKDQFKDIGHKIYTPPGRTNEYQGELAACDSSPTSRTKTTLALPTVESGRLL